MSTDTINTVTDLIRSLRGLPPGWKVCVSNRAAGKVYDIERVVVARFGTDEKGQNEGVILIDFEEWEEEFEDENSPFKK